MVAIDEADGFEQARDADGVELRRQHRLLPRGRHERLRRQVVDLARPQPLQHGDQRQLVEQVGLHQLDVVAQMLDAREVLGAGAAHHAEDLVALLQQQLGQVRAVLPGDAGDQCARLCHRLPFNSSVAVFEADDVIELGRRGFEHVAGLDRGHAMAQPGGM